MTGVAPPDLREEPTTPAPGAQDSPVGGISGPQTETRQVERDGRKFTVVVSNYEGDPPPQLPIPLPPPVYSPGRGTVINENEEAGQSAVSSVATLCNSAVGAGVLSLPFAFRHAGLLGGLLLCLTVGFAEGFTLYVLSKFAERYDAHTYGRLVHYTLGRKLAGALASVMTAYIWGSCCAYLMIIGDTLASLLGSLLGDSCGMYLCSRNMLIIGIGFGILLPLCMLRKLGHLSWLSACAVIGFAYTSALVLYEGLSTATKRPEELWEGVPLFKFDSSALVAVGIIVFSFNCHANVVSVFSELTSESDALLSIPPSPSSYRSRKQLLAPRPTTVKLVNMIGVILTAVLVIFTGYVCVGAAGVIGWPDSDNSNVLADLPQGSLAVQIANGVIAFVVMGHYPLNHFPARAGLHDALMLLGISDPPSWAETAFTVLFVCSNVGMALYVHSLGNALNIIGGTAAAFMIFFLPGLILINSAVVKQSSLLLDIVSQDPDHPERIREPLLRLAAERGIKGVKGKALAVFSRRKSLFAGVCLIFLSAVIVCVTLYTTFIAQA